MLSPVGLGGAAQEAGLVFPLVREKGVQRHHHALVLSLNLGGRSMKAGHHGLAVSPESLSAPHSPGPHSGWGGGWRYTEGTLKLASPPPSLSVAGLEPAPQGGGAGLEVSADSHLAATCLPPSPSPPEAWVWSSGRVGGLCWNPLGSDSCATFTPTLPSPHSLPVTPAAITM